MNIDLSGINEIITDGFIHVEQRGTTLFLSSNVNGNIIDSNFREIENRISDIELVMSHFMAQLDDLKSQHKEA